MINQHVSSKTRRVVGFTLVELTMVVSIIALLTAITIGVGASMADSGRKRATVGVIQVLDKALDDYINTTGGIPPALVRINSEDLNNEVEGIVGADNDAYYPAIDGVLNELVMNLDMDAPERHYVVNSVGLFIASAAQGIDIESLLSSVDNGFVKIHEVDGDLQPELLTVFDAWGNPIRYVHPKFDGVIEDSTGPGDRRVLGDAGDFIDVFDTTPAGPGFFTAAYLPVNLSQIPFREVRRNKILQIDQVEAESATGIRNAVEADSDGGTCATQRPYFYSCGPDGDPSTVDDNIYTIQPNFINPF
jgi:type II secretory pathway pseudopilin PulG